MRPLTIGAGLATLALLAGCSSAPSAKSDTTQDLTNLATTTDAASSELDQVTWDLSYGEPESLDPIKSFNYPENTVVANLCEGLMQVQPDLTIKPNLASQVEQPDDRTYVYTLRQGVQFWNGDPMTADDVVFSLKRQLDPDEGSYWAGDVTGNIASVDKTGEDQVTVKLKNPDVTFNGYMSTPIGNVVEKSFRTRAGDSFGTPQGGVMCTGPYQLDSWQKGSKLTIARNDSYWNTEKRAKTEKVVFRFIVDGGALSSALGTGGVDGAYDVPLDSVAKLRQSDSGALTLGRSLQIVAMISTGDGPLGDPRIRRALAMATDREAIAKVVYAGTATAARSVVPPGGWSYGDDVFGKTLQDLPDTKVDIEGAKKLVAEAGSTSAPITIAYPAERQYYADILSEMANAGRKLGLTIQPKGVPSAQYGAFFSDPKARAGYGGFMTTNYMDIPDPLSFLRTMAIKGGSQNYNDYDNPAVADLLDRAAGTQDEHERAGLVGQALTMWEKDMPWIPVVAPAVRLYMDHKVTGAPASFCYLYYPWAADLGGA
jgi:peptide/nickel transport system substrate-binding protein